VLGDIILCKLLALVDILLGLVGSNLLKMSVGVEDGAGTRSTDRQ
jgi:hypothetical protein